MQRLRRVTEVYGGAVRVAEERELDGAVDHDRVLSVLLEPLTPRDQSVSTTCASGFQTFQADLDRPGFTGGGSVLGRGGADPGIARRRRRSLRNDLSARY